MKKLLVLSALLFSTILFSQKSTPKTGCVSGNCKNGFGKFVYENGTFYEGKFKKEKFEGKGLMVFATGEKYTGEFKDGQQMGQGKTIRANGNIWEGENIYGNPNGNGKMIYLNGSRYEGIMNRYCEKNGEGTYTLSNGYGIKGTFQEDKPLVVEYFDSDGKKISKDVFETLERKVIADANENFKQQHQVKLQQFILKNNGVIVQNINVSNSDSNDLSAMSYRTSNIDILFSNKKDGLICIQRNENRPSSYDITSDQVTIFSVNSQKLIFAGYASKLEQNELGKDIVEKFKKISTQKNIIEFNYFDNDVLILDDLNKLTAPAGNVVYVVENENHIIFKDIHREEEGKNRYDTYYFINRKTNTCEKIVNVNTSIEMVWNEDFTKSCMKLNSNLPENLIPDALKFGYYSSLYLIDWEQSEIKHIDNHINQLNYLKSAINNKISADQARESSRAEREIQSKQDWADYYENERKINENIQKSKDSYPKPFTSNSSRETTVKTTTITKSGNEIISFDTVYN